MNRQNEVKIHFIMGYVTLSYLLPVIMCELKPELSWLVKNSLNEKKLTVNILSRGAQTFESLKRTKFIDNCFINYMTTAINFKSINKVNLLLLNFEQDN